MTPLPDRTLFIGDTIPTAVAVATNVDLKYERKDRTLRAVERRSGRTWEWEGVVVDKVRSTLTQTVFHVDDGGVVLAQRVLGCRACGK